MRLEDLGLIGNCQIAALVNRDGAIVWSCFPRFDSDPVFASLLNHEDGGRFQISPAGGEKGTQRYLDNTNVLETLFVTPDGSFRVLDFAPRFRNYDRMFRPTQLMRIIEPISGSPRVVIHCDPRLGWSNDKPTPVQGSNHIRYEGFESQLRLTTDIPLSYTSGIPFVLTERKHMALTWGNPIEEPLAPLCERFQSETVRYWHGWVKHCNVPTLYQKEVIRAALVLKLHCYEDTGAIAAALTTSIPESPGSGRNWDYRYCWLRDAYYSLGAFRLLGQFEEREAFTSYLLNVAADHPDLQLNPLYRIDGRSDLEEHELANWPGFNGSGPVRIGNGAASQIQLDVFGETVLALAPVFLDDRFRQERSNAVLELLNRLSRKAIQVAGQPDAGIWELRTKPEPQTFSSLMCWAAADRMALIAARHLPDVASEFADAAKKIRQEIVDETWLADQGVFASTYGGKGLDASLLQMVPLRFLSWDDDRLKSTVETIRKRLSNDGWLHRYNTDDGFGTPEVAFTVCTFWLIEALSMIGRRDDAKALLDMVVSIPTPLGLLAEDYDPVNRIMWGNHPQAYSHVGLIHAAFAASPPWAEIL